MFSHSTHVTESLDELDIPYRVFVHDGPIKSLQQAAEERGQQPEQIIRLPEPLRILADPAIFEPQEISIGSGVRGTTVILSSADLRRALPAFELVNLRR